MVQANDGVIVNTRVVVNFVFLGLSTDLGYGIRIHFSILPIVNYFLRPYWGSRWLMMFNNIGIGVGLLGGG